jgi:hypothetical protein
MQEMAYGYATTNDHGEALDHQAVKLLPGGFTPSQPRVHVTDPHESAISRPRRRPPRIAPFLLVLVLLVAAPVAWYGFRRPRLLFTNQLAAPIWLAVGQAAPVTLAPGTARTLALPTSNSLVVQWNLARPLSADQRPMGEELRGSVVIRDARGVIRHNATVRPSGTEYFAPLITNASEDLLRITVNAGLEGAVDCGCAVRPGAQRVFVGYYRLYRNSTVRARNGSGGSATFRDLGPSVTAPEGTLGLRFESKDFR